ncbi:phosphoglycolate phosphatase [Allopseudospirillum japonicum]|uniref:phosphoglycolate phosphatase n=1 Tax=Allopseudospirillum japonicum TaxID=64971 RepID=A0A1H6QDQ7_9GAMM|nr:phosphoglycolate phosphatase [Allopseudospirillum japonicum]SEI37640.1 phosphoglycolate phosphatase [Allopseudospirillum japonicum]
MCTKQQHPAWQGIHPSTSGVLFDLDGTLIDSALDLATAVNHMRATFDLPAVEVAQVRLWVGEGAWILVQRALQDLYLHQLDNLLNSQVWDTNKLAQGEYLLPRDDARIQTGYQAFIQAYQETKGKHVRLYPGAQALLQQLYKLDIKLALVTNKPERFLASLLAQAQIDTYFTCVLGGDTLAQGKPHPLPLLTACERLQVEPQKSLMIGDSRQDILAARAASITCVAVTYGYHQNQDLRALGADYLVDSLTQLL